MPVTDHVFEGSRWFPGIDPEEFLRAVTEVTPNDRVQASVIYNNVLTPTLPIVLPGKNFTLPSHTVLNLCVANSPLQRCSRPV